MEHIIVTVMKIVAMNILALVLTDFLYRFIVMTVKLRSLINSCENARFQFRFGPLVALTLTSMRAEYRKNGGAKMDEALNTIFKAMKDDHEAGR